MSASEALPQALVVVIRETPDQEPERPAPERVAAQRAAARVALAEAAERAGCPDRVFEKTGPRGKPLPTAAGWSWSISHDATLVAGVVAFGHPVGVDVERIGLRRRLLVERVADEHERALFGEADEPLDALGFTRVWTAKEAVLKAERVGLPGLTRCKVVAAPFPSSVELEYEGSPRVALHTRVGDHLVSACSIPPDARPRPVVWSVPARP